MTTNFCQNLRELRKAKGYTLKKIKDETGIGEETIHNYEKAKCYPSMFNLIKLAQLFELSLDEIVFSEIKVKVTVK